MSRVEKLSYNKLKRESVVLQKDIKICEEEVKKLSGLIQNRFAVIHKFVDFLL